MAAAPIRPRPFFEDKNRAFWTLQSAGWFGALAMRALSSLSNDHPFSIMVPILISTIAGYSITILMAVIFRGLLQRAAIVTWGVSIVTVVGGAAIAATIDAWVWLTLHRDSMTPIVLLFLGNLYIDAALLVAWSALYYAINFFITMEEQATQLIKLENQAVTAQLTMLRYQLNPHFLFNTLNSISTLVLLKQTDRANAMLSRLSAFLRYTLVNEPTAQVTLAQEIETLKLYLEIEKMRFEERLRTHFAIDPSVADARLPSLLLQPLVENAIKYAVTPKEEGADISISAQLDGKNLRIVVSDTGPGLQETIHRPSMSTGVGLANIRDRLAQAYGEHHHFETRSSPGGGFTVMIDMPYSIEEQTKVAA